MKKTIQRAFASISLVPLLMLTPVEASETKPIVSASDAPIIRLWPIERVGGEANRLKEEYRDRRGRKQLCGVLDPNLSVYQVKSDKPTPAVVYCPGGAYMVLGLPSEKDIKNWHDLGITVFVLKYTIPDKPGCGVQRCATRRATWCAIRRVSGILTRTKSVYLAIQQVGICPPA